MATTNTETPTNAGPSEVQKPDTASATKEQEGGFLTKEQLQSVLQLIEFAKIAVKAGAYDLDQVDVLLQAVKNLTQKKA